MKYLRKILLSASLFGAVCAYADTSDLNQLRIGLGGMYGMYQENNNDDIIKNIGGYIALVGRNAYVNNRIFAEAGFELLGFGASKAKGGKNELSYWYDGNIKLGFNPFSQANPLFINAVYSFNRQGIDAVAKDFETGLHSAGLDLHGFLKGSGKTTYEYNVGYYYVFHGYHYLGETRSGINDYSYAIKGHIGFASEITPKVGYFMNLKAKYYYLAASDFNTPAFNRPLTKHLVTAVELGLQF